MFKLAETCTFLYIAGVSKAIRNKKFPLMEKAYSLLIRGHRLSSRLMASILSLKTWLHVSILCNFFNIFTFTMHGCLVFHFKMSLYVLWVWGSGFEAYVAYLGCPKMKRWKIIKVFLSHMPFWTTIVNVCMSVRMLQPICLNLVNGKVMLWDKNILGTLQ